jgi:ketosteroid isomerase-like protein
MMAIVVSALLAASAAGELIARENEWSQALLSKDAAALEKILGAEYTLTTAGGVVPRAKWIDMLLHHMQPKQLEVREPQVQLYGDVALVRGRFFWHVLLDRPDPRTNSSELKSEFLISDLWVKRDGRWQVVARHSTLPAAPPAK